MLKINTITKQMHYDGKILKNGNKKFTGDFSKTLPSGITVNYTYKKGLLKTSFFSGENGIVFKSYEYDDKNNLINVDKNGEDIFEKKITHNIGINYSCTETINNVISRTYDSAKRIISYVISPKLLFGFVKYSSDMRIDTRYFLNNGVYKGNGVIGIKNKSGNPILNNGEIDKIIVKNLKTNHTMIVHKDHHKYTAELRNKSGQRWGTSEYTVDKNGKPIWYHIENKKGETVFDKKTVYDAEGKISREIYSECGGKWFNENNFDKNGNIILQRKLNNNGELIQTIKREYNSQNLLERELTLGKDELPKEEKLYKYDKNNKLRTCETLYYNAGINPSKSVEQFYRSGGIKSHTDIYSDEIAKEFYDRQGNLTKSLVETKSDGGISTEYLYDSDNNKTKTIRKVNNKIIYTIDHSSSIKDDIMEDISVYKDFENKLLGKEILISDNKTGEFRAVYTDKQGREVDEDKFSELIRENI